MKTISFGTWMQTGDVTVAEIIDRLSSFEYLAIDCEHTGIGIAECSRIIQALSGRNTQVHIRTPKEPEFMRRCLDIGADGIIAPRVDSMVDLRMVIDATRFPPLGRRGCSFNRDNQWGRFFDEQVGQANEQTELTVMIESVGAVKAAFDIAAEPGVDTLLIGPYDLSMSFGIPGQVTSDTIIDAGKQVVEAAHKAGKRAALHIVTPSRQKIAAAIEEGYDTLYLWTDTCMMAYSTQWLRLIALDVWENLPGGMPSPNQEG